MTHEVRSVSGDESRPRVYVQLLALSVLLFVIVGFNLAVWGLSRHPKRPDWQVPVARPERGPALVREHGCIGCHTIPGVREATGKVGPRLDRVGEQVYIAGVVANSPQNLAEWIANPKEFDPRTAMPDLGVNVEDARDIAAYLYSLR
jgi:cytochrome c2